jgi:TetR/AcrR family transcriptional regulator, lmrAB and yxaGH operons repressor
MAVGTRDRMICSASGLVRENGVRATSFALVLADSGAPRGSVGHHFPGGKAELIHAAVAVATDDVTARLTTLVDDGASARDVVEAMCDYFAEGMRRSGFRAGCAVAAVALDGYDDPDLRAAAASAVTDWVAVLAALLRAEGRSRREADDLAQLSIAAVEGALLLARVQRSTTPLTVTRRQLGRLVGGTERSPRR